MLSCAVMYRKAGWRDRGCASLLSIFVVVIGASPTLAEVAPQVQRPRSFRIAAESGFVIDRAPWFRRPFDTISADMDGDGDPDLLINWHHHEPLELFENRSGRYVHLNPIGADPTGLYDNADVPYLYADMTFMTDAIAESGNSGLYLWHDISRAGFWRLRWHDPDSEYAGARLGLETTLPITNVEGLAADEVLEDESGRRRAVVTFDTQAPQRDLALQVRRVATELYVELGAGPDGKVPPLFVGRELTRARAGSVSLWKPDPHGMAWVNVRGDDRPEVFITRGGLGGELLPPARPKSDRFYLGSGAGRKVFDKVEADQVPRTHGRGRRVEWVDVDGDGILELSIAGEKDRNSILRTDPKTGRMSDIAESVELDLVDGAIQAWGDFNEDGLPDLYYLTDDGIDVREGSRDGSFRLLPGPDIGLSVKPVEASPSVIQPSAIRFVDFDSDGDLDLWLVSHGRNGSNHLYRRDPERYTDVSEQTDVDQITGANAVVFLDADNDGDMDAVNFGKESRLWRNQGGERFDVEPFGPPGGPGRFQVGAAADVDGDGRTDVLAIGRQRFYLRNVTLNGNGFLTVELVDGAQPPIGAVVIATFSDGSRLAQRLGSAASTAYSQAAPPLHFGIKAGVELSEILVRWPGRGETSSHREPGRDARITIRRPPASETP